MSEADLIDALDDICTDLKGVYWILYTLSDSKDFCNYDIQGELLYMSRCVDQIQRQVKKIMDSYTDEWRPAPEESDSPFCLSSKESETLVDSLRYTTELKYCINQMDNYVYESMARSEDQQAMAVLLLSLKQVYEKLNISAKIVRDKM